MNPYTKAALFIIRLVAFAFVLFGALPLGADYFARRQNKPIGSTLWLFLEIFSLLLGFVLLFKSGAIAKKLTEDFEE
ncbi:MAG: hypothetical protein ABI042_01645 [Verrucomicrobiota bacterium]